MLQVYLSFIIIAWLTCLIAAVDLFCSMSMSCNEYLSERGNGKSIIAHRFRRSPNYSPHPSRGFLLRYGSFDRRQLVSAGSSNKFARLDRLLHKAPRALVPILLSLTLPLVLLFRKQHPRIRKFAQLSLDILCDIQVVTGTAISRRITDT